MSELALLAGEVKQSFLEWGSSCSTGGRLLGNSAPTSLCKRHWMNLLSYVVLVVSLGFMGNLRMCPYSMYRSTSNE